MKITVIGCGNAFSQKNFNQSFLLEENDRRLLIDCGYQVPAALQKKGIDFFSIDDIYVSHLHADHIGGLEYFAFMRYDFLSKPRYAIENPKAPKLIGNKHLLENLWNQSLRGGLESMEGFVASLDTFFVSMSIQPNATFVWQGWIVRLVQQIHVMSGYIIMPSFGLIFSKRGHETVYFTTDSQHCSPRQMEDFYEQADIIFQDCECIGANTDTRQMKFSSGVHANYAQLAGWESANSIKLSSQIKEKMYLSHYQDFVCNDVDMFGNSVSWNTMAKEDGFRGFIDLDFHLEV
jgi:ribonuclease BN (tRNA processing enzyme)